MNVWIEVNNIVLPHDIRPDSSSDNDVSRLVRAANIGEVVPLLHMTVQEHTSDCSKGNAAPIIEGSTTRRR